MQLYTLNFTLEMADNSDLHSTADELARDIEQQIEENKEKLEEVPDFPMGRRAREQSTVPSLEELVNG